VAQYAIDLHNHMPVPDADYRGPLHTSGAEVVGAAIAAGLDVLGVSDHFSLGFFRRAHEAASGTSLLVLPGAEVRLSFGDDEVHLVALFAPEDAEERFEEFMACVGFSERLRTDRLHRVVIECDPVAAARCVADLGGICVVAHVDRRFGDYRLLGRPLLRRLVDEVPGIVLEFLDLSTAAELGEVPAGLTILQSSDSHCLDELGRRRTIVDARGLTFDAIRQALSPALAREAHAL
jgi:PHP family Zn ribbon phosphoesterase